MIFAGDSPSNRTHGAGGWKAWRVGRWRSADRGECNQACRLPYQVTDPQGRIIAHDKHVLSMKDNDQSANLAALIDAGIQSFKIEGRYRDMGDVKNITAHHRALLDGILEDRPNLARASSGRCTFSFKPDPAQNFNREATDYFVQGRTIDIGVFDCKPCEMHVIGKLKRSVAKARAREVEAVPMQFYRTRPGTSKNLLRERIAA